MMKQQIILILGLLLSNIVWGQTDCYNNAVPTIRQYYQEGKLSDAKQYIADMEELCEGTPTYTFKQLKGEVYGNQNTDEPDTSFAPFTETVNGVRFKMIAIEGGSFEMGSNDGRSDEQPVHRVNVPSFYMGETEVTHTQYITFLNDKRVNSNGSYGEEEYVDMDDSDCAVGYSNGRFYFKGSGYADTEDTPMIYVTWYGAKAYCDWLSNKTGKAYRLPSEAEWEYTARAGTNTPFYTGNNITTSQANYDGDYPYKNNAKGIYRAKTTAVKSFAANPWGLYDMSGNVWEWCEDRWHDSYSGAPTNGSAWTSGRASGRVLRGGGWIDYAENCRSANRFNFSSVYGYVTIGFRLALTP